MSMLSPDRRSSQSPLSFGAADLGSRPARRGRLRHRARLPGSLGTLHEHRQHVRGRDVIERARDLVGELHIRIEFGNQFANKRHIDRPGDDVDAIRAHIR